jgi:methionyl-tRNA formyltransferase
MQSLKIIFAGTPQFALPSLQALEISPEIEVCAVFTQPDKPAHRGQKLTPPPVKEFAEKVGIRVYQPEKITQEEIAILKKYNPDFLVVVAYGLLLPEEVLSIPKYGCVNLHGSLLPKYRGASPIQAAILSGDEKTGVSFMQIEKELDAGGVFARYETKIGDKNSEELAIELASLGGKYFPKVLQQIASGELKPIPQIASAVSFTRKIRKEMGKLDFVSESAWEMLCKLRAYTPWPGIFTTYKDKNLKILAARISPKNSPAKAGEVIQLEKGVGIQTREGIFILEKVQLEGKKPLTLEEFIRGEKDFIGSRLS